MLWDKYDSHKLPSVDSNDDRPSDLSFTIARSMVSWHRIPSVIIVCTNCSAWVCVLLLKGEMCCVYCQYGVYYSAPSNINSWNICRIGTDFLPGNHKIWFPISIFSLPPWSLQNMIEYLRSLGINNRLHKDIRNMYCCRVIGCTRGWFVVDPKIGTVCQNKFLCLII